MYPLDTYFLCLLLLWSFRHYAITWVSSEISDWEYNFCVNFVDAIGSTNSRWIQSKHDVEILSNHNKAMKIAYFISAVHANCLRTVALDGVWNSRFSTFNQKSSNKETTNYNSRISTRVCRPFELLVNFKFALRGSDSFRSSEPKETNALNACNVKWPVYCTNTRPIHISCNRASKRVQFLEVHLLKFRY